MVWLKSTSLCSLIVHSLKWRCFLLVWPISLSSKTSFEPLGRNQSSFGLPARRIIFGLENRGKRRHIIQHTIGEELAVLFSLLLILLRKCKKWVNPKRKIYVVVFCYNKQVSPISSAPTFLFEDDRKFLFLQLSAILQMGQSENGTSNYEIVVK